MTEVQRMRPLAAGRKDAVQGLTYFFALLVPLTAVLQHLLIRTGEPIARHLGLVSGLMWVPGAASIVTRLLRREGFRDVSFVPDPRTANMVLAWLYAVGVGTAAYGTAWLLGLSSFAPPALDAIGVHVDSPVPRLMVLVSLGLSLGTLSDIMVSAGEEIGWRGYMLTRLIDARVPNPVLVSGLVWAFWHAPLIVSGQYASGPRPVVSLVLFSLNVVALGYVMAVLRLRSGSIWPPVVAHASWNAVIQGVFDASTRGAGPWVGEDGLFVALASVAGAWLISRGKWPVRRAPNQLAGRETWRRGRVESTAAGPS
jgi:membrane protease YdiL (CAAX protease family)